MTWTDLPKVELHLHHEGAAPPAFIRQMAHEKRIDLSGIFTADGHYRFEGFTQFLATYEAATSVLTDPEAFRRLTLAILEDAAQDGVIYCETFISPDFCGGGDVIAWRDYLAAIEDAAAEAERRWSITHRAIATCIRHFGPEKSRATARCAAETAGAYLTGFGMGGDEMQHAPGDFAWAYDCAREAGLQLTCHAGEWGGAAMVRATLDDLRVQRIGHGIGAAEDPALMQRLAETGVALEVCPGSNVALGAVSGWAAHPIAKLRDAGVTVTVSTDDPPFFHVTRSGDLEALARVFGWGQQDFLALANTALDVAFCDAATRDRLRPLLEISE